MTDVAYQGDLVDFEWEFRRADVVNRPLFDPDNVFFSYQCGDLPSSVPVQFNGNTQPAIGIIWKRGVGRYASRVDTTNCAGALTPKAWSTGTGQAQVPPDVIQVVPRPF
jgi:hypothetical protein